MRSQPSGYIESPRVPGLKKHSPAVDGGGDTWQPKFTGIMQSKLNVASSVSTPAACAETAPVPRQSAVTIAARAQGR